MNLGFLGFREPVPVLSGPFRRMPLFVRPPQPPAAFAYPSPLGAVRISQCATWSVPFCWSFAALANPHIAVVGMSGSGKSFFVKTFLTRANLVWGTHALIIDWSGEYAQWVTQAGGVVVSLKDEALNLLDLGGMAPVQRAQQVVDALALLADLPGSGREKQWVRLAIEQAYALRRFIPSQPSERKPPTLKDVVSWLKVQAKKADPLDRREIEGAALMLRQLTVGGGDFFARPTSFKLSALLESGLVCVDLSGLPSESMRSLAGLTLLQFVRERMRSLGPAEGRNLRLFVVLDEAWKICREDGDPSAIVREGRKYSFGLLVASQNPTDVSPTIFSNAGSVFAFRTAYSGSLDYLQRTLRFPDCVRTRISSLTVGECAVHLQWAGSPRSDTFFLKRVEGEALLEWLGLEVFGVEYSFEKQAVFAKLRKQGVVEAALAELDALLSKRANSVDSVSWASALERAGLSREDVRRQLKEAGLSDEQLSRTFAGVQLAKMPAGTRFVEVSLKK